MPYGSDEVLGHVERRLPAIAKPEAMLRGTRATQSGRPSSATLSGRRSFAQTSFAPLNDSESNDLSASVTVESPEHRSRTIMTNHAHTIALISADLVAALVSLPLALVLLAHLSTVHSNSLADFWANLAKDSAFPIMVVIGLAASGLYRVTRHAMRPSLLRYSKDLVFAVGTGLMLALGLGVALHVTLRVEEPSTTQLLLAVMITSMLIVIARTVLNAGANRVVPSRVVVVGTGSLAERVAVCLRAWSGTQVLGKIVPDGITQANAIGTLSQLPKLCAELRIDRVIFARSDDIPRDYMSEMRKLRERVHISVIPTYFDLMSLQARLVDLAGIPMIEIPPNREYRFQLLFKRTIDIVLSLLAFVILSPLFTAVAIAVAVSSPGPIFFKQERQGHRGRPFTIYKFRSMAPADTADKSNVSDRSSPAVPDPCDRISFEPLHVKHRKLEDDERTNPVGRFLRRRGLDELPQFWNVLKGEMSVVGPRPLIHAERSSLDEWQSRRFDMRPGITGLWQVSGRNDLEEDDLFALDYVYVTSWSMWWDIKIILETPRAMVRGIGAY